MNLALLLLLALAPPLIIIVYIWFKDKYNKEPIKLLLFAFLLGTLSIIPAIILELIGNELIDRMTMLNVFIYAFFVVALSEEGMKFLALRRFLYRKTDFNEPFDGIIYSVMISMGFAAVENVMYVLNHGFSTGFLRMFTAVPGHAGFAIMMGYFVGKAKFTRRYKTLYLLFGLISAIVFHGLYDFFLLQNDSNGLKLLAFAVLLLCVILSFKAVRNKKKYQLTTTDDTEVPAKEE